MPDLADANTTRSFPISRAAVQFGRWGRSVRGLTTWIGRSEAMVAASVTLLGFATRFYHIAAMPYWLDEWLTVRRAQLPLTRLIAQSFGAHHFPTYFLLIAALTHWGIGPALLRLPSAMFGALSAGLAFAVASVAGGRRAGIVAGILVALSPLQVQYGQEARSYTLTTALMLLGLLGAVRLAAITDAGFPNDSSASRRAWATYIIGTVGALIVLGIAMPWLIAAQAAFIAIGRRAGAAFRRLAWRSLLIVVALFAPALAALLLFPHVGVEQGFDWIPPLRTTLWPSVAGVYLFRASNLVTLRVFPATVPGFGVALVVLAAIGAWHLRRRPALLIILAGALVALPATLLITPLGKSILMPRYLLWSGVPFFIFVGVGIEGFARFRKLAAALVCGVAALSLAPYYHHETKPRWDLATRYLAAHVGPSDVVLVDSRMVDLQLSLMHAELNGATSTRHVEKAALALADGKRVWATFGPVGQSLTHTRANFIARLAPLGPARHYVDIGRTIVILDYAPETMTARDSAILDRCSEPEIGSMSFGQQVWAEFQR